MDDEGLCTDVGDYKDEYKKFIVIDILSSTFIWCVP